MVKTIKLLTSLLCIWILVACGGGGESVGSGVTSSYSLGGSISGLGSASGLTLANGTETLSIAANATAFTFTTKLAQSASYNVTVANQPVGLACSVNAGAGVIAAANVNTIAVVCIALPYSLGGSISGLDGAAGLTLANGTEILSIDAYDSVFRFATKLAQSASYDVTVASQPVGGKCSVNAGAGVIAGANVDTVAVVCNTKHYGLNDLTVPVGKYVIRSQSELGSYLPYFSDPLPSVDFSSEMVIGVSLGASRKCHRLYIEKVDYTSTQVSVQFRNKQYIQGSSCLTNNPIPTGTLGSFVVIPNSSLPVAFVESFTP